MDFHLTKRAINFDHPRAIDFELLVKQEIKRRTTSIAFICNAQ
jgi:uridine kinase